MPGAISERFVACILGRVESCRVPFGLVGNPKNERFLGTPQADGQIQRRRGTAQGAES
jgi:hypothetical protein